MFSSLTSYLFGTSGDTNNPSTDGAAAVNNQLDIEEDLRFKVTPTETEDDWLIVDKDEEESLPQTDSEEEIPFVEIRRNPPNNNNQRNLAITRHQRGGGTAFTYNQDAVNPLAHAALHHGIMPSSIMEESWFLTPPPCFISTGPVNMVTSPFENLLIEHPSMSVYHSIRSNQITTENLADYEYSGLLERTRPQQPHPVAERSPVRTIRVVPRRAERIETLTNQQVKQGSLCRNAQKVHEKKARQVLCRGALKRGNKVRDFNSKGGRPRRSDMQHCKILSGANNNRKC